MIIITCAFAIRSAQYNWCAHRPRYRARGSSHVPVFISFMRRFGITEADEEEFLEAFDISAGVQSLESVFEGEMPHHTFDELAIIKEPEDGGEH